MINLHCPDFYTGFKVYEKLIELYISWNNTQKQRKNPQQSLAESLTNRIFEIFKQLFD